MVVENNYSGGNLEGSEYPNVNMWVPICVKWLKEVLNEKNHF
jgi:hypothetical protein